MVFLDRIDAGRHLAVAVGHLRDSGAVVLGVPRGGVTVAFEVAKSLDLPLDVLVVGRLGVPGQPGLVMGAVGEDQVTVPDEDMVRVAGVNSAEFAAAEERARAELERRVLRLRGGHPGVRLKGRTAIVVDDGIVTGASARTACRIAQSRGASRVILAVPVGAADPVRWLRREVADEVICLQTRDDLVRLADYYADFSDTSEEDVVGLLEQAEHRRSGAAADPADEETVVVPAGRARLPGRLMVPSDAVGLIVFAHDFAGSGHAAYETLLAAALHRRHLGTLRIELRTPAEDFFRAGIVDVPLLTRRLCAVADWLRHRRRGLPIGYLGAGAGAAAALSAAARTAEGVTAVVSSAGLPHLAGPSLPSVQAATLLIVGDRDEAGLDLNRRAIRICAAKAG